MSVYKYFSVLGFLLLLGVASGKSTAEAKEILFVANNKAGTVSAIDIPTYQVLCEIDVNPDIKQRKDEWSLIHKFVNWYGEWRYADDIRVSPDGKIMYVSRASLSDVAAFRLSDGKMLWRVPLEGYRSDHMNLTKDGRKIFVSAIVAEKVFAIGTERGELLGSFNTGSQPHTIEFTPDEKFVVVGEKTGKKLLFADINTLKITRSIEFKEGVRPFEITDDGKTVYLQLSNFHGFLEYDLENDKINRTINLPENEKSRSYKGDYQREAPHHGLSLSDDEKTICIAATAADYIALISRPELKVVAQISVGVQPSFVIQSLDGEHCYVSSRGSNTVSIISYKKREEVKRIKVGDYPQRLFTAQVPSVCEAPKSPESGSL